MHLLTNDANIPMDIWVLKTFLLSLCACMFSGVVHRVPQKLRDRELTMAGRVVESSISHQRVSTLLPVDSMASNPAVALHTPIVSIRTKLKKSAKQAVTTITCTAMLISTLFRQRYARA